MIYEFPITTAITDTKANPKKTTIKLTHGTIHQLDIISDESTQRTLYLAINRGLYQVFPSNPDTYFSLGGEPFSFREAFQIKTEPYELEVYTYLVNADYSHKVTVRIAMLEEDDLRGVLIKWSEETPR